MQAEPVRDVRHGRKATLVPNAKGRAIARPFYLDRGGSGLFAATQCCKAAKAHNHQSASGRNRNRCKANASQCAVSKTQSVIAAEDREPDHGRIDRLEHSGRKTRGTIADYVRRNHRNRCIAIDRGLTNFPCLLVLRDEQVEEIDRVHQNRLAEGDLDPLLRLRLGGDFVVILANAVTIALERQAGRCRACAYIAAIVLLAVVEKTARGS